MVLMILINIILDSEEKKKYNPSRETGGIPRKMFTYITISKPERTQTINTGCYLKIPKHNIRSILVVILYLY